MSETDSQCISQYEAKKLTRDLSVSLNFLLISSLVLGSAPVYAESTWDGKYNSTFPFQMSRASVCPKFLPIDIEIKIEDK